MSNKIEILHSDSNVIIVNKAAGIGTIANPGRNVELTEMAARQLKISCNDLRLVGQIDDEISGIAILARNKEAKKQLSKDLDEDRIRLVYIGLVHGAAVENEETIRTLITRSRANALLMTIPRKKGVEAVTHYRLMANFSSAALLAVTPLTHRRHQVRVHLSNVSLPAIADAAYGNPHPLYLSEFKDDYRLGKQRREKPLIERCALHIYQLSCDGGLIGRRNFVAALPKKLAGAIKMLTKHNADGIDAFVDSSNFEKILSAKPL